MDRLSHSALVTGATVIQLVVGGEVPIYSKGISISWLGKFRTVWARGSLAAQDFRTRAGGTPTLFSKKIV